MSAASSFGQLAEGALLHAPLYFADAIVHFAAVFLETQEASLPAPDSSNFSKAHWAAESHICIA